MPSDVFILPDNVSNIEFAQLFLASKDFTMESLKDLARRIGLRITSHSKSELITLLSRRVNLNKGSAHSQFINQLMVYRSKEWMSLQKGTVQTIPELEDPSDLITSAGKSQWYGPVKNIGNNNDEISWYIKPVFINHWNRDANGEYKTFVARWLCFARVTHDFISLHWQGFTYAENPNISNNVQFPYWDHIPLLFEEIKDLTNAKMEYVNLHDLMLERLWNKYQSSEGYRWKHIRIRAESNGVSLNAHAGSIDELNVSGVLHLAEIIRKSIQEELLKSYQYTLPYPDKFDGIILRTLIKRYGALSYEFSLEEKGNLIFKSHSYFGMKPNSRSTDSFAHMRISLSTKDVLSQLYFLLDTIKSGEKDDNNQHQAFFVF